MAGKAVSRPFRVCHVLLKLRPDWQIRAIPWDLTIPREQRGERAMSGGLAIPREREGSNPCRGIWQSPGSVD
ncbi:hypothetical protein QUF72_04285 [Desulfobacterales bacterium HSG2]|nr:hypothetical protein [Desulfobacterales bacterium HSG2]